LQMRESTWEQNWERAVDRLQEHGQLDGSEISKFKSCYSFLRRCELVLRRYENRNISTLPRDPNEQQKFAVRLGYCDLDALRRDYIDARETIHALYERHVISRNRGSASALQPFNAST
jgi:glutamine synthetase adenylyltransferase